MSCLRRIYCESLDAYSNTRDQKKNYKLYFDCSPEDQDKLWAPHVISTSYSSGLRDWYDNRKKSMPLTIPIIWRSQKTIRLTVIFGKITSQDIQRRISTKLCIQTLCIQSLPIPFDNDFEPDKFSQAELNNLVRDLSFSKDKASCWYQNCMRRIC